MRLAIRLGFSTHRALMFSSLGLAYILVNFHRLAPAVLAADLSKELGVDKATLGVLSGAYYYSYAAMQPISGLIADSVGPRVGISVSLFLAGIGSLMMSAMKTLNLLVAARMLVGLGCSLLAIGALKTFAAWYSKSAYAVVTGFFLTFGGVGGLLATFPLAWLSQTYSWQLALDIVGGGTIVLALACGVVVCDRPENLGYPAVDGGATKDEGSAEEEKKAKASFLQELRKLGAGLRKCSKRLQLWLLFVWGFCMLGVSLAVAGLWGGPYLEDVYNLSSDDAGTALMWFSIAHIVFAPAISYLSDRVGRQRVLAASACLSLCLFSVLAFTTPPQWTLGLVFTLVGIIGPATAPVILTTGKESVSLEEAGTGLGIVNPAPFVGSAVLQPLAGWVIDTFGQVGDPRVGYFYMYRLFALCGGCALVASLFIQETNPRRISILKQEKQQQRAVVASIRQTEMVPLPAD